MALAISKFMEQKTQISLARIIKLLKSVTEVRILDKVNNEEITFNSKISDELKKTLNAIGVSY